MVCEIDLCGEEMLGTVVNCQLREGIDCSWIVGEKRFRRELP